MDDLIKELQQLQQYAAGLQGLIANAEANAPARAEGTDSTGAVHVVLGPNGVPKSFRVEGDWERKLKPEAFGDAVVGAFQAAMDERLKAWSATLSKDDWQSKVDNLDRRPEVPVMFQGPKFSGKPRSLDALAEEMIKAFDDAEKVPDLPEPNNAVGTAGGGKLVLTLSKSAVVSCVADSRWVSAQTATRLTNALSEALAMATRELEKLSPAQEPANPLDRLIGETFALLSDPQRLADS
ncbi:DNA-binding protein YbaB [Kibdelosporangium banguiense]|uniref:DNA-binding protein YbaB n=1 Tax=Kibdelosporangium banguiense TaxID=1365924 RepID=A0ABS4TES0_9PSEU|nr:YbaB/EbfC family nucleoid-associated protein [Kibdelosporangium banguiense]MBP2322851.1 DNA-binding protein YbaB [Kibdelosporangium banguiense]